MTNAQMAFLSWLKKFSPTLYQRAMNENRGFLNGLFDFDFGNFIDKTIELGGQYLQYDQQKELLELQAERAKANQLPFQTPTAQTIASEIITIQQQQRLTPAQQETERLTNQLIKLLPWMIGGLVIVNLLPTRSR